MAEPIESRARSLVLPIMIAAAAVVIVGAVLILSDDTEASHFRGGTLQWNHTPARTIIPNPLEENLAFLSGSLAYRCTAWFNPCTPAIVGAIVPCGNNCPGFLDPGTGTEPAWNVFVTKVNVTKDWWVAKIMAPNGGDDIAQYYSTGTNGGSPWEYEFTDFCRVGGNHVNNPCGAERMVTQVNLEDPNRSPVVDLIPMRYCQMNAVCTFPIYAMDPDNDTLSFRLATACEADQYCKFRQPGPPDAQKMTIDPVTGVVTWDTTGARQRGGACNTIYSVQVQVSDGLTSVPEDFMIELCDPPTSVCPDGSTPVINPETQKEECPKKPLNCSDPTMINSTACQEEEREPLPRSGSGTQASPMYYPDEQWSVMDPAPGMSSAGGSAGVSVGDSIVSSVAGRDSDGDGVADRFDLCPNDARSSRGDRDGDGVGDSCDDDKDGDGLLDGFDACPLDARDSCVGAGPSGVSVVSLDDSQRGFLDAGRDGPGRDSSGVSVSEAEASGDSMPWFILAGVGVVLALMLLVAVARRKR